jgi:hypothetical protein
MPLGVCVINERMAACRTADEIPLTEARRHKEKRIRDGLGLCLWVGHSCPTANALSVASFPSVPWCLCEVNLGVTDCIQLENHTPTEARRVDATAGGSATVFVLGIVSRSHAQRDCIPAPAPAFAKASNSRQ